MGIGPPAFWLLDEGSISWANRSPFMTKIHSAVFVFSSDARWMCTSRQEWSEQKKKKTHPGGTTDLAFDAPTWVHVWVRHMKRHGQTGGGTEGPEKKQTARNRRLNMRADSFSLPPSQWTDTYFNEKPHKNKIQDWRAAQDPINEGWTYFPGFYCTVYWTHIQPALFPGWLSSHFQSS